MALRLRFLVEKPLKPGRNGPLPVLIGLLNFMKLEEVKLLSCWWEGEFYTEEWKPVLGYEEFYQISSFGRVFSEGRMVSQKNSWGKIQVVPYVSKLLNPTIKHPGYFAVCLSKDKKEKSILVHRLVAVAFISNPENKPHVNHKDGDKRNPFFKNLEWNTPLENNRHAYQTLLNHSGQNHAKSLPIHQYTIDKAFIRSFSSTGEIFRECGLTTGCIASCARGERQSAHGFYWSRELL